MAYRNVEINGCRSCQRQDHDHWVLEPDRERERYRAYQQDRGRPTDDEKRARAA